MLVDLLKKTNYNAKITEIEDKIRSVTGLTTTAGLPAKIPDISNLVKKTDYDAKISHIESKYINTADYNKFTENIIAEKIKSEGLVDKSAFSRFINNADLNKKNSDISNKSRIKSRAKRNNKAIKLLLRQK